MLASGSSYTASGRRLLFTWAVLLNVVIVSCFHYVLCYSIIYQVELRYEKLS